MQEKSQPTPIVLEVVTVIKDGKRKEKSVIEAKGTLYEKADATFIMYEDELEVGKVSNTVKIVNNDITIIRRGAVSMRQHFVQGKLTEGVYQSPLGTMGMMTKTKQINFHWNPKTHFGKVDLSYELTLQDHNVGTHTVTLKMKGAH
ncbi:DUF1934 domain-containing protein [Bacillus taeanensis]|uniref:DUF1934 domain-containing protein n=1 Tax=Bacillus taeanensis TaxID=273032 RepID=A0A366XX00_9BACI|nr:DUF1934 domain-containing protein [Bacillus taeanensis]RBW68674.1 DUF1934 domain-containing protein [Bacillus taeanensis]